MWLWWCWWWWWWWKFLRKELTIYHCSAPSFPFYSIAPDMYNPELFSFKSMASELFLFPYIYSMLYIISKQITGRKLLLFMSNMFHTYKILFQRHPLSIGGWHVIPLLLGLPNDYLKITGGITTLESCINKHLTLPLNKPFS